MFLGPFGCLLVFRVVTHAGVEGLIRLGLLYNLGRLESRRFWGLLVLFIRVVCWGRTLWGFGLPRGCCFPLSDV